MFKGLLNIFNKNWNTEKKPLDFSEFWEEIAKLMLVGGCVTLKDINTKIWSSGNLIGNDLFMSISEDEIASIMRYRATFKLFSHYCNDTNKLFIVSPEEFGLKNWITSALKKPTQNEWNGAMDYELDNFESLFERNRWIVFRVNKSYSKDILFIMFGWRNIWLVNLSANDQIKIFYLPFEKIKDWFNYEWSLLSVFIDKKLIDSLELYLK